MRLGILIQARLGSTRYPRKILETLAGHSVLKCVIKRCERTTLPVMVAMPGVDNTQAWPRPRADYFFYNGAETDCAGRLLEAATANRWGAFVRVCADSPLIDPLVIQAIVALKQATNADYVGTEGFPHGQQAQIYDTNLLARQHPTMNAQQREHVIVKADRPAFIHSGYEPSQRGRWPRLTIDDPGDLKLLQRIVEQRGTKTWMEMVNCA